jgi:site-specific DNA recombinase
MKIAVYVRVSTQRQAQTLSIEQQLERLNAYILSQGWELLAEDIFRDDGYSGASLKRPGLDRLRDAVALAGVDRVLMTAPDRLARNYVHQVLLLEELQRHGCRVEFLDRPMSEDPHDQLLLQIRGAVAEYERTLIAERMRRGRLAKLQAGLLLPWTSPPYGYRHDPDRPRDPAGVRLEPAEAAVVQDLFAWYREEAVSLYELVRRLEAMGLPSPTGQTHWNAPSVRRILTNPVYTGQVYAGRTRICAVQQRRSPSHPVGRDPMRQAPVPREEWLLVATVPALVASEQFEQVQAKLTLNQQAASRNNTAHDYLLRALVSCGACRFACIGRVASGGYPYYVCSRKTKHRHAAEEEAPCPTRYLPAPQLDELVWADLCTLLRQPENLAVALARAQGGEWLPQELQARRRSLRQGRASLLCQLERLTEAYLAGVVPLPEYERRRRDLEGRQAALEQQMNHLEAQVDRQQERAGLTASMASFCERVEAGLAGATFLQKRELVELLIDRIVVTGVEVEIRYVIPTSPAGEKTRFCHLRLDYFHRVARPQVHPVRLRIIIVGHQPVPVLGQHLGGTAPVVLLAPGGELPLQLGGFLPRLGIHDLSQPHRGRSLAVLRHPVQDVEDPVVPAALLVRLRIDLGQGGPESQVPVRHDQAGSIHPPPLQVAQQRSPALGRLPMAALHRQHYLAPVRQGGDHHQERRLLLLQTGLHVDPIRPEVDYFQVGKVALAPGVILLLPDRLQPANGTGREWRSLAQQPPQRQLKVTLCQPVQVQLWQQLAHCLGAAGKERQHPALKPLGQPAHPGPAHGDRPAGG